VTEQESAGIEVDQEFGVQAVRSLGKQDREQWVQIKWLGHLETTLKPMNQLPQSLKTIARKSAHRRRGGYMGWSICSGNASLLAKQTTQQAMITEESSVPILYHDNSANCTINALLCILHASKNKAKRVTTEVSDFAMIADKAAGVLKVNLQHTQPTQRNVDFVLNQKQGMYLLMSYCHTISVDCNRKLIFDPAQKYAMPLTKSNLDASGFPEIHDMRKIQPTRTN
jgi:hypothetical protein